MKATARTFEPPTLTQIAEHGGYFCTACSKWTEPTEDTLGNAWMRCAGCGAVGGLQWHAPTLEPDRKPQRVKSRLP